ncbi:YbaY family lipoprotein [Deinococcus sp. Arct2-2]|uniref:YbaY family lipoprotein n=1 Tax=Deinococcus sp. Arct2-2 TaxID=2568653 RepID=UPI001454C97E|nr:YbaY family lipoprotein [Deinococcus sp. Arct2-2]
MNRSRLLAALAALLLAGASAQTSTVGGMTITRSAPVIRPAAAAPASANSSIPAGWRELRGQVLTPSRMALPAGSTVTVVIEDVSLQDVASRQLVKIQFAAPRLPASYQIVYNPVRFSASRSCAVRATVTDKNGKLLYVTDTRTELPMTSRAVLDVKVIRVR